jgi:uncharacterized membrane protein
MEGLALARALHVLAVVIWIGGVSMVTSIALPAVRRSDFGADGWAAFQAIERRFVWQARGAIIIVGATGIYMIWAADLWDRFASAAFWWMHAMVGVWTLFALGLFVVEPFILDRRLTEWASRRPDRFFAQLGQVHWVLLLLSFITLVGAVAGSHGWPLF